MIHTLYIETKGREMTNIKNEREKALKGVRERRHPEWDYQANSWKLCPHCRERHNPASPCP